MGSEANHAALRVAIPSAGKEQGPASDAGRHPGLDSGADALRHARSPGGGSKQLRYTTDHDRSFDGSDPLDLVRNLTWT